MNTDGRFLLQHDLKTTEYVQISCWLLNDGLGIGMRCRFEFHEILIRASFGKYITPKILDDSSDSVKRLLEEKLLVNLPQEARLNPNDFRRDRFYTREMEAVLKFNWDLLNATFKLYKAKDKTKYFWIEHWIILLEAVGLMGSHTGKETAIKCVLL